MAELIQRRRPVLFKIFALSLYLSFSSTSMAADEPLPGATLLHKFPSEVYRLPVLTYSGSLPVLVIWADAHNPEIFNLANPAMNKPAFDVVLWEITAGKILKKMPFQIGGVRLPVIAPADTAEQICSDANGMLALAPNLQSLVYPVQVAVRPGQFASVVMKEIKMLDIKSMRVSSINMKPFDDTEAAFILYAPNGRLVIAHGDRVTIFESGSMKIKSTMKLARNRNAVFVVQNSIRSVAVSADGAYLAVSYDGKIDVFETKTGQIIYQPVPLVTPEMNRKSTQFVCESSMLFSATGDRLYVIENVVQGKQGVAQVRLFDFKNKKELSRFTLPADKRREKIVVGGTAAARGLIYFTPQGEPRVLQGENILDGTQGALLHKINAGLAAYVSHDGKYLVRVVVSPKDATRRIIESWSLEGVK